MRKLVSVLLTAGLLVSLAACTSNSSTGDCTALYPSGDNSSIVTAKGTLGSDPHAQFPTPLVAKKSQVSVVSEGKGKRIEPGASAAVQITIYDGTTGSKVVSTNYQSAGLLSSVVDALPEFGGIAQCATVGSRVAAVGTAGDLLGADTIAQNNLPFAPDTTVVLVADVLTSYLGRADGADQSAPAGFPSIVLAPDGRPGFTFASDEKAPTDLRIANLKVGSGPKVAQGDSVVVNYTSVLWAAKKVVAESSWEKSTPAVWLATSILDDSNGVIPGLAKAVIGQRVGSQVIVVIPPKFGYPAGSAPSSVPEGSTLVYVVDVLGIAK